MDKMGALDLSALANSAVLLPLPERAPVVKVVELVMTPHVTHAPS